MTPELKEKLAHYAKMENTMWDYAEIGFLQYQALHRAGLAPVEVTGTPEYVGDTERVLSPISAKMRVTFRGATKTINEWSETLGVPVPTLVSRLRSWTVREAFTRPVRQQERKATPGD